MAANYENEFIGVNLTAESVLFTNESNANQSTSDVGYSHNAAD